MKKQHDYYHTGKKDVLGNFFRSKFLWVLVVLLVLANIAAGGYILYLNSPETIHHFTNPFPLIDPSRSFIAQEHFLSTIEPVRKGMKEFVASEEKKGNRVGVYFEYLNTGANVSINQDERFWPASLSKMPTVMAVMKKIEKGEWKLSNELVLFSEDQDARFGDVYKRAPGTRFTIEELLREVLVNSDNTAHKMLVRNLSSENYTDMFEALGMEELFDKNYDITAKEYSRIFRVLFTASYLNRENSQKILSWLSESQFREFLGAGIPADVVFSHKIGEEYEQIVFLDSGIIYVHDRPCLITVMVKVGDGGGVESAKAIMKELSNIAYKYVAKS